MAKIRATSRADFESIPVGAGESFVCREFHLPAFTSPWHYHPEVELTLILGGTGQRFVGDSIEPFALGDLVLLGSNLPHYWRSDARAKRRSEFAHSLVIQFRPDFLGAGFLEAPELRPVARLLGRAVRGIRFGGGTAASVARSIGLMKAAAGAERISGLIATLAKLAAGKARYLSSAGYIPDLDRRAADRISRSHQYVYSHIDGEIRLDEAAGEAGMSASAFCRYFRRITGKTFFDFVNGVRTARACRLLIETDQSVTGICHEAGFSSLSNFNRRFRERQGVNPTEYRRAHQGS